MDHCVVGGGGLSGICDPEGLIFVLVEDFVQIGSQDARGSRV